MRRDAGDASDLDVQLATVSAGQAVNTAADDSLAAIAAVLDLQAVIGMPADRVVIVTVDSLTLPADMPAADSGRSLTVAAAEATLQSEEHAIALARRSVFAAPSVTMGFETGDPERVRAGHPAARGFLRPPAALQLERRRCGAGDGQPGPGPGPSSRVAQRESGAARSRAMREQLARACALGTRGLLGSADRVASMSLTAYAEGAVPLANVLEARRAARDALGQYIDDLALANIAAAAVRLFTLTVPVPMMRAPLRCASSAAACGKGGGDEGETAAPAVVTAKTAIAAQGCSRRR